MLSNGSANFGIIGKTKTAKQNVYKQYSHTDMSI